MLAQVLVQDIGVEVGAPGVVESVGGRFGLETKDGRGFPSWYKVEGFFGGNGVDKKVVKDVPARLFLIRFALVHCMS